MSVIIVCIVVVLIVLGWNQGTSYRQARRAREGTAASAAPGQRYWFVLIAGGIALVVLALSLWLASK